MEAINTLSLFLRSSSYSPGTIQLSILDNTLVFKKWTRPSIGEACQKSITLQLDATKLTRGRKGLLCERKRSNGWHARPKLIPPYPHRCHGGVPNWNIFAYRAIVQAELLRILEQQEYRLSERQIYLTTKNTSLPLSTTGFCAILLRLDGTRSINSNRFSASIFNRKVITL